MGSRRKVKGIEQTPGPGDYNPPATISQGFTIGLKRDTKQAVTPGPGEYEVSTDNKDSFTIRPTTKVREMEVTPGPGYYEM